MINNTGYNHNTRPEMLAFLPNSCTRLLDVGCHAGDFGLFVKSRLNAEVWGIDPNPAASEIARGKLDHVIIGCFDEKLSIPDDYFDVIVFNDVLEHFVYPDSALQLCKRKLTLNGVVVCSIPNVRHIENVEHLLFEKDWRYEDSGVRDRTHLRFFTRASILRLFIDNGYEILEIKGINPKFWSRGSVIKRLLFRLFPRFMEDMKYIQFAVVAKPIISHLE